MLHAAHRFLYRVASNMQHPNAMRLPPRECAVLAALVVLALCMRGYLAWVGQWSTDPDRGIVNLMALHMAEGRAWPVFYYGQAYMGSLEPFLSSLFVRLLGPSGFAVGLGTAVPAALLVIPVYFLARRIAGPLAATLAAAFLVIGPDPFAAYMSSPRGGYALVLLFNTLILLLGARIADRAWRREPLPVSDWIWIGLLGGLGWWIGPMVLSALGAAGLVALVALRGRFWIPGVAWAAGAFVAGAAPWWLWNARNDWQSLSMFSSVGGASVGSGAARLLRRTWDALGFPSFGWSSALLIGLILALSLAFVGATYWRMRRDPRPTAPWALAATLLFVLLFGYAYSTSSFNRTETLRYLLPLYPAVAVLFGAACAAAGVRSRVLAVLVALPFLVPQVEARMRNRGPDSRREEIATAAAFAEELSSRGIDAVFATYHSHWKNFVTRGAFPFVEPTGDCVPLNDRAGLLARRPAYLLSKDLETFADATRTRATVWKLRGGSVAVDLQRAATPSHPLPLEAVAAATVAPGGEDGRVALDQNVATSWRADSLKDHPTPALEIRFTRPVCVTGLRLFSRSWRYPLYTKIEGRAAGAEPWQSLTPDTRLTDWYWSGPQLYARDLYYAPEISCSSATVTELRVSCPASPNRPSYRFYLSEVVVLEADAEAESSAPPDPDAVVEQCRTTGVRTIYAHRWLADRIGVRELPDLQTDYSARLRRTTSTARGGPPHGFTAITNLHHTAFYTTPACAAHNRAVLETAGCAIAEDPAPGGRLLRVTRAPATDVAFVWTGDLLLRDAP